MSSCSVALVLLNKRQGFAKDSTVYKNSLLFLKQVNEWIIRGIDINTDTQVIIPLPVFAFLPRLAPMKQNRCFVLMKMILRCWRLAQGRQMLSSQRRPAPLLGSLPL